MTTRDDVADLLDEVFGKRYGAPRDACNEAADGVLAAIRASEGYVLYHMDGDTEFVGATLPCSCRRPIWRWLHAETVAAHAGALAHEDDRLEEVQPP